MALLTLDHVRSIEEASIALDGPITLLCGDNEAGKTSILLALKACLTGTTACISMASKWDAQGMLAEGDAKQGSAMLSEGDQSAIARWTKTKCEPIRTPNGVAGLPKASTVAAGLPDFLSMPPKDRAEMFLAAFAVEPNLGDIASAIVQSDLDLDADKIWSSVTINGWDGALRSAQEDLTRMKGEWRGVTGETWSEDGAADWAPSCMDETSVTQDQVDALTESAIEAAEKAAEAKRAYDAIQVPPAPGNELVCAHCGKPNVSRNGQLVKAETVDEKERERLQHAKNAAEGRFAGLRDDARAAEDKANLAAADLRRSDQARDDRIEQAAAINDKIARQAALVGLLGMDGVRATKRDNMLTVINGELAALGTFLGMEDVRICWEPEPGKQIPTICVRRGNHLYQNLCRSERWRVRLLLQLIIAKKDGSTMVLLDDCEILSRQRREPLIRLLLECGVNVVAAMTISDGPENAPDLEAAGLGQTYWVEGGTALPLAEARRAVAEAA